MLANGVDPDLGRSDGVGPSWLESIGLTASNIKPVVNLRRPPRVPSKKTLFCSYATLSRALCLLEKPVVVLVRKC